MTIRSTNFLSELNQYTYKREARAKSCSLPEHWRLLSIYLKSLPEEDRIKLLKELYEEDE